MDTGSAPAAQLSLLERPAKELLANFGAGKASPGAGSAAALMGLLSVKLLLTVCDKSLEKPECQKDRKAIEYIKDQVLAVEPELVSLFEKDAREFDEVVALRIARDHAKYPADRAIHSRQANDLLEVATENAFQIVEHCMKLIDHGLVIFESGWHAVRGDSGAALSAAMAGVMSGIFIANLNIKALRERKYAVDNVKRCAQLYRELESKQQRAFVCVTSLNKEAIDSLQLDLSGV